MTPTHAGTYIDFLSTGYSRQSNPQPILKPCPFCGSQNLAKYRFNIGGFLDKPGCTETICENGDTFRIECDCGCKLDKCQDELFDKAEEIYTCDGKYDVEITDADMWNIMIADWNRRVSE